GADFYRERVDAPAFTFSPTRNSSIASRPRVPNRARNLSYGFFAQDTFELIPRKLRLSTALRYSVSSYESRASNSPLVNGRPLFPDDSLRVDSFAGRAGVVFSPVSGFDISFNYSRGFRAPSITDLGTLGLTGDGFEIASTDITGFGGTIGNRADDRAISTGIPIAQQRPEVSNNYDLSLRYHKGRIETDLTGFIIDINDTITKQALILPQGAVGKFLGDQPITRQLPNGVVFVPLSASPVLVRANLDNSRLFGFEYTLQARISNSLLLGGNFTYIRAKDKTTGLPPNIEGGTPAPAGFISLRYTPQRKRYWVEVYSSLVYRQERLSSLDLADRRTGATRSRTSIANFFNNGARFQGLVGNGMDRIAGTADDILLPTGETLAQVQSRLLGNNTSAPLFPRLPGYGLINARGGIRINENSNISIDFENIADKSYRGISWGIDGPGRSLTVRYTYKF
ncbi:MAG: TonB-dependent receptor, partial [Blastocatellia bacterium]|nr:TonB-dependent receptor [Blastocatellia bacterium]